MEDRLETLRRTYARLPNEPEDEESLANWEAAHGDAHHSVVSGTPPALRGGAWLRAESGPTTDAPDPLVAKAARVSVLAEFEQGKRRLPVNLLALRGQLLKTQKPSEPRAA